MTFEAAFQLFPEWILLIGACVVLMMGVSSNPRTSSLISMVTTCVVGFALLAAIMLGRPDGHTLIPGLLLDSLTYYVRVIGLGVGVLLAMINWYQPQLEERGEYMSLLLFSLLGLMLVPSANDLVVLFFAIELVGVPTYILVALSRTNQRASEAGVKYFFLGAMAAAILAYGLSLLYGATGTTIIASSNGAGLSAAFGAEAGGLALIGLLLVFGGLCFKIAAAPFHAYVPDVYEGAASPITAFLGFIPKLAGFVAMIKIFAAGGWNLPVELSWIIWLVAAATMTLGNVLALLQTNIKRMLGYSSIAHSGYMLLALLVGPVAGSGPMHNGVTALLFYMAVYGVMNLGIFAALTSFKVKGESIEQLSDLSGLSRRAPLEAFAMVVCAFSLMGFPPTAGFLGKVYIFSSAFSLSSDHAFHSPLVVLAVIGVINSAIGAAYYLKIAAACYLNDPTDELITEVRPAVRYGLLVSGISMLFLFVWPTGLIGAASNVTVIRQSDAVAMLPESVSRDKETPLVENSSAPN